MLVLAPVQAADQALLDILLENAVITSVQHRTLMQKNSLNLEDILGESHLEPQTEQYVRGEDSLTEKLIEQKLDQQLDQKIEAVVAKQVEAESPVKVSHGKKGFRFETRDGNWQTNLPLTAKETLLLSSKLSNAGKIFRTIQSSTLKEIESNKELNLIINIYNNRMVRAGQRVKNTKKHANGLIMFVNDRYAKEIDKRSSQKGKDVQIKKRDELLAFFSKKNLKNLQLIFDLQNLVIDSKLILINKLNKLSKIGTFVKTTSGFKVTNPEGFVAIDRMEGGAVKLVDRMEFSTNNFSKDIIKGWDNPN